jgi:lipoprotein-anchoring transpeptidase ErfK/SrfK
MARAGRERRRTASGLGANPEGCGFAPFLVKVEVFVMRGFIARSTTGGGRRRAGTGALAGISALSLLLAGCSSGPDAAPTAGHAPAAVAMSITSNPADGSSDVITTLAPVVTAAGGRLSKVVIRSADGQKVPGVLTSSGTMWRATGTLAPGSTYTVQVVGLDSSGRQIRQQSSFSTQKPKKVVKAFVSPLAGQTVGIGQPIVVTFSKAVKDRAAVESRLLVETSKPVVGAWHWMSDKRVHFRPTQYWPDHTKVTLRTNLKDVNIGRDIWGDEDRKVSFEIGRSQVSVVDVDKLTMTVTRDGKVVKTFPVSTGKPGFRTRGGKKVVLATERSKTMDARSIGISPGSSEYYNLFVEYAVRMTWSGEFVHAAPWSVRSQGRENVSHGCVGMSMDNARWFYDHTIIGDVIDVVGSKRKMELENGYGDWNLSWEEWLKGSALPHEAPAAAEPVAEPAPGLAAAKAPEAEAATSTTAATPTAATPAAKAKPAVAEPPGARVTDATAE